MKRRQFLGVASGVALAGCVFGGGDVEDDRGTSGTENDVPTVQDLESPDVNVSTFGSVTVTVESITVGTMTLGTTRDVPEVEIVSVDHPERVTVGQDHTIGLTIENVGDTAETVVMTVQRRFADSEEWTETVEMRSPAVEIEAGETVTISSRSLSFDTAGRVHFRMPQWDVSWSYEVEPADIDVSLESTHLVPVEFSYETRPMAEVTLVKSGTDATDDIDLTADWYDSDGNHFASTEDRAPPLTGEETAVLRVDPILDVDEYGRIDDCEVTLGSVEPFHEFNPDGITVQNTQLETTDSETRVLGEVRNDRENAVDNLWVAGKVKDDAGTVLGWSEAGVSDVPAEETVAFELDPMTGGRDGAVASHELLTYTI